MNILTSSDNNVYWVEKRRNFVKLCFAFTPEMDEDLNHVDFIYAKVAEKIMLDDYKIFSITEEKSKQTITLKTSLKFDGFMHVLVPTIKEVTAGKIEQLLAENKCNLNNTHKSFYSSKIVDVEKCLAGSLVITQSYVIKSREFTACPIDIDPYYLAVYSVDIYGDNVQNIDWELNKK